MKQGTTFGEIFAQKLAVARGNYPDEVSNAILHRPRRRKSYHNAVRMKTVSEHYIYYIIIQNNQYL